jgi:hypothetical protein
MKIFLCFILLFFAFITKGQTPQSFKYQTSIRDNAGNPLINKVVAIKLSIVKTSANGIIIYSETHNTATSDFGIVNFNVGEGIPRIGNFSTIDWSDGPYFLKTDLDINNGTNYLFMGTTQLLSVPYALFAGKAANAADDKDKDSLNEIQQIGINGNQLQLSKSGGLVNLDKYIDNTDSQRLSLQGNTLTISGGNSIVLAGEVDLDSDPLNEVQNLTIIKDTLKLSKSNYVILPKDSDTSSFNELQILNRSNDTISISKGNFITLQKDFDRDSINEIQNLTKIGDTLSISKSNYVVFPKVNSVPKGSIVTLPNYDSSLINLGYTFLGRQLINFQNVIADSSSWQWGEATELRNAPKGTYSHTAVWTGTYLIFFGREGSSLLNHKYDPIAKNWTTISTTNAPTGSGGSKHSAVWTGTDMIIAGGSLSSAKYNLSTDTWSTIASPPISFQNSPAVWTGTEMIVITGYSAGYNTITGLKYNPVTNNWSTFLNGGGISLRSGHSAVWTGTEIIVFGGYNNVSGNLSTGGRYNPTTDSWILINSSPVWPSVKDHSAVWTGNEMILWGGNSGGGAADYSDACYIYKPQINSWEVISQNNIQPTKRSEHTANWVGNKMIIWGGRNAETNIIDQGMEFYKVKPSYGIINRSYLYLFIKN